jgi:hypothetical protein
MVSPLIRAHTQGSYEDKTGKRARGESVNFGAMISLEGMLIIAMVIAVVGTAIAQLFRNASSPYLITITGTRPELFVYGASLWIVAVGTGIAALLIVSSLTSSIIGLAIFFGIEAVALDICAHRTQYVRTSSTDMRPARVYLRRSQRSS